MTGAQYEISIDGIPRTYRDRKDLAGRSPDWLKFKNPAAPAVRREAEEDWGVDKTANFERLARHI